MKKYVFLERGNYLSLVEGNFDVENSLKKGIYNLTFNPDEGLKIEKVSEQFEFNFKLYGIDETLVGHVIDTYKKQPSKHNIGVLLNGAKGTGKTVTAKVLANRLDLPVIIVPAPYPGLTEFISHIHQDCVFFFDEFEKNFRTTSNTNDNDNNAGQDLLSIMDGVYNTSHCHIFLLTTNELRVNDNIISRPSRIRYLKSFGNVIDRKIVECYIDDNLLYPERKEEIMEFIESLTLSTIDIIKSIVEEVNIHNCSVDEFKGFFNVKEAAYHYYTKTYKFSKDDKKYKDFNVDEFLKTTAWDYGEEELKQGKEMKWSRSSYNNATYSKSFKKLKKGEVTPGGWKIVNIWVDKSVILFQSTTRPDIYLYEYITNPEAKPSVFEYSNSYSEYDCEDW